MYTTPAENGKEKMLRRKQLQCFRRQKHDAILRKMDCLELLNRPSYVFYHHFAFSFYSIKNPRANKSFLSEVYNTILYTL